MKLQIFTLIFLLYTSNIFGALPPGVQKDKDHDTLLHYVNSHPKIKQTDYSINTYAYTIVYPQDDKMCTITFVREQVFRLSGWVGPATSLIVDKEECEVKEVVGYDYYKKEAIKKAHESDREVRHKYKKALSILQDKPEVLEAFKQNQEDWLAYRYSFCQTKALREVYPSTSRLYTEVVNNCTYELNKKRKDYLDDFMKE